MSIFKSTPHVAYFSMEIALDSNIKTYSGGLGILAGDLLRSAADLKQNFVGVTLLSSHGYFDQKINQKGEQEENKKINYDFSKLTKIEEQVKINIAEEQIVVGAWKFVIKGESGGEVPVYLLDTDLEANPKKYRDLTSKLYGGNDKYRLLQEIVLGRAGYKLLKQLNYNIFKFHLNEGHAALTAVALFSDLEEQNEIKKLASVRERCVFTLHTPIKAAYNVFSLEDMLFYQPDFPNKLPGLINNGSIEMPRVALYFSRYTNAVSLLHQRVAQKMFPAHNIQAITNGIHSVTWTSNELKNIYDRFIPNWRQDNSLLNKVSDINVSEIWQTHQKSKQKLIDLVKEKSGHNFSLSVFTIVWARRFALYKRPALLLQNMQRLLDVQKREGKLQIIYAGKAHPADEAGKKLIAQVNKIKEEYQNKIEIVFLENYEMDMAKVMLAGADLWLNTPIPPNEASGTSGMKAAHNGVPQLSTNDGWWPEGYVENKTGWIIPTDNSQDNIDKHSLIQDKKDAINLYNVLEKDILPLYYKNNKAWQELMRSTISINAPLFNTNRALQEYLNEAYID